MSIYTPYDAVINVPTDNDLDNADLISKGILKSITWNRLNADKPSIILITGDSGEGKTATALRIVDDFLAMKGIDLVKYLNDIIVYNPFEYAQKLDSLLVEDRLKHINVILLDEARGIVKAANWNSYVSQAIADANALSRGVKPLLVVIVSQDVSDIDRSTRKTIRYEFICKRPLEGKVRIKPVVYYKFRPRGTCEKMELRYRDLRVLVKGIFKSQNITPPTFVVNRVRQEVWSEYKKEEKPRKLALIRSKTTKIISALKKDFGGETESRVDKVFNLLKEDNEKLSTLTEVKYGKRKINFEDPIFLDWSGLEKKELSRKIKEMVV